MNSKIKLYKNLPVTSLTSYLNIGVDKFNCEIYINFGYSILQYHQINKPTESNDLEDRHTP